MGFHGIWVTNPWAFMPSVMSLKELKYTQNNPAINLIHRIYSFQRYYSTITFAFSKIQCFSMLLETWAFSFIPAISLIFVFNNVFGPLHLLVGKLKISRSSMN